MATSRSTTPRSTAQNAKPDLDLDAYEVDETRPFRVKVGGKLVRFHSVMDLDWQVVADFDPGRARAAIDQIIFEEDKDHFYSQKITAQKINHLFDLYLDHFGIVPGESVA